MSFYPDWTKWTFEDTKRRSNDGQEIGVRSHAEGATVTTELVKTADSRSAVSVPVEGKSMLQPSENLQGGQEQQRGCTPPKFATGGRIAIQWSIHRAGACEQDMFTGA